MAVLSATFRLVDEMSARLDNIARTGELAVQSLEDLDAISGAAFDATAASANSAASALDNFERETTEAANAVDELTSTGAAVERALEQEGRAADQAADQLEQFGDTTEQAGEQSEQFGNASVDAIQDLSKALAAAGIAKAIHEIYSAFANAVGAAIEFESAITGVYKTVDGTTEQLSRISAEVKAMSTIMPASATDIAAVAEAAGQLGIATDDVTTFTEVMINLGEATNLSADEAASSLAKFTNITGMAAKNYESLGSTVVALGNNFATTEADIVAMSTNMASAGTLAGLTEPEILALAAAMSSVGIEAAAGGSAMSKLLTDIQVAVETGSDRLEEFASVAGMTGTQFADAFGSNASEALYSFISGLNDVERNGASATVILEEMGITEVRLSNAIKSLANSSDSLSGAIGVANSAWSANTALSTEASLRYGTLESRISMTENAADNLAAALGEDLSPAVGFFVDAGRGALEWFTGIIEKHPAVSAGFTAVAVGVGITGAALMGLAIVNIPAVTAAISALGAALAVPPVGLIVGIVAVTAAVVAFVAVLASQKSEYDTWTASTKNQYDELQELNAEYERAAEVYGETSDEALALRYEVDDLTAAFEASKKTVEQFVAESEALIEQHQKMLEAYETNTAAIRNEELGALALVHKLEQLGSKTNITAAEQEQMKAIIEQLNTVVPDLALNYDDVTNSLDTTIASLQKMAQEQAAQEKQAENYRTYVDLLKEQTALEEKLAAAEANLTAERERTGMVYNEQLDQWESWYTEDSPWASWTTDLDDYKGALTDLQTAYDENLALQEKLTTEMGEYAQQTEEAKAATITYGEAVSTALSGIQTEMAELAAAYDESYQAARDSIDGVIGLFDTMKTETELSIADMTAALQSQSEYLITYTENLRKAAEYGLDDGLIASLSDGSAESAGQLDAIIGKIEELGGSTEEAAGFISSFNDQFAEVEQAKDEFAATVAEMQTDFSSKMDEMEQRLTESIDNMNMETEAAVAAKDTMQAYIAEIRASQADAVSAAEAVASATAAALGSASPITASTYESSRRAVGGYATGTESAERGLALVGEEGPELIDFSGGERVYTARETREIINNTPIEQSQAPVFYAPADDEGDGYLRAGAAQRENSSQKKITLDINGSGEIDVTGADEETVWDIVAPRLKDAFMGIVRAEVFEEGERSYAF